MPSFIVRKLNSTQQKMTTAINGLSDPDSWSDAPVHPWRRFFARILDLLINAQLIYKTLEALFLFLLPVETNLSVSIVTFSGTLTGSLLELIAIPLLAAILNALLFGITGWTIGKFLFGIKVRNSEGKKLNFKDTFKRELNVYVLGLGLGIPVAFFFTFMASYFYLCKKGKAIWDEQRRYTVFYHNLNYKQLALIAFGILLFFYYI